MECLSSSPVDSGNGQSPPEPAAPAGLGSRLRVEQTRPPGNNRFHPDRNPGGWEELVLNHREFMLQFAERLAPDAHTAEDIVQEALRALWVAPWTFSPLIPNALRRWLKRHVTLAASRVLRPWRIPLTLADHRKYHRRVGERPARRHEISREDMHDMLDRAKIIVRKRFRNIGWKVFEAVYENGQDPREAAESLGISRNVVYIYGCRIFSRLQEEARRLMAEE